MAGTMLEVSILAVMEIKPVPAKDSNTGIIIVLEEVVLIQ